LQTTGVENIKMLQTTGVENIKMLQTTGVENIKTHILYSVTFFKKCCHL